MDNLKGLVKKGALLVVALLIVGIVGYVLGQNSADEEQMVPLISSEESIYSSASDLRKDLNITLAEHVALTNEALRVSYDDHESSTAIIDELDKNSRDLANIIGELYGEEPKATFLKMWQDQITFFVNYTVSTKNDDKEGQDQALSDLEDFSQETGDFFAGLNSNLSADQTQSLFTKHRDLLVASIIDYSEARYADSFEKESRAYIQAGEMADAIADGTIKQFPDKFNE